MDKKLELIDRFIYEKALERTLNEVKQGVGHKGTNEPEISDFDEYMGSNPRAGSIVVKIGPGVEDEAVGSSEGTYAVLVESDVLGRKGIWQRKYSRNTDRARDLRNVLTRKLAVVAKDAFLKVLQRPLKFGPRTGIGGTPFRKVLSTRSGDRVRELFVARGNPLPNANIPDITPGRRPRYQDGDNLFNCSQSEEGTRHRSGRDPSAAILPHDEPDIRARWQEYVARCREGGFWSKWYKWSADQEKWILHLKTPPEAPEGAQAPRTEEESGWQAQVGKVVWGWRPQWHHRIIEVPSNNRIGDVKMRVVDFVWPGKPTRKEPDNFTFYLRDIDSNHRLTQHVKAQLSGDDQYEIKDAPAPPSNLREALGGGPKVNYNKRSSWQGWTSESEEVEEDNTEVDEKSSSDKVVVTESTLKRMIREVQQMTMNPFVGEEIQPPQEIPRPVIQGRVDFASSAQEASDKFSTSEGVDLDVYKVTCQPAAGSSSWTCVATKSDIGAEQDVTFPDEEGPALDDL